MSHSFVHLLPEYNWRRSRRKEQKRNGMKTQEIYYKTKLQIKQTKNNFKENLLPEIPERQEAKKKKEKSDKKKNKLCFILFLNYFA